MSSFFSTFPQLEAVQALLDADADVNILIQSDGATPLHLACAAGRTATAQLLLRSGKCNVGITASILFEADIDDLSNICSCGCLAFSFSSVDCVVF